MRRIWIVGAKGLVGTALCSQIREPILTSGREVDIADFDAVYSFATKNDPITHIVNCAAFSQVDLAESHKEQAMRDNALGPETLGRLAKQIKAKLLHLSTDYVFDKTTARLLSEKDIPNPCNRYGWTKWEGEKRLAAVFPEACILRTSWVFGIGGKNFVARLIELLQTNDELKLVRDQTSRPTYAPDLCSVILQMLDHSGLYHFANKGPTNKYEFALALIDEAKARGIDFRCKILAPISSSEFLCDAKRPLYTALDTQKIEQLLSAPVRHWRDCLTEYLYASLPASH